MTTRTRLHELLVVAGLTGFAFSQPLLAVLGDNPIVFTRARVEGTSLVVVAVVLAVLPPLVLWGAGALAALVGPRLGNAVHLVTVGVLVGLVVIQLGKQLLDIDAALPLTLGAVGGALLFVAAYDRIGPISMWSRFTAPLPLLALALFLLSSPAGALARSRPSVDVADEAARSGPPVVFVILDEFPTRSLLAPDGNLDRVRFPRLAEFAEDATWYRHYTTMAPLTTAAVPSILSGRLPNEDLPTADEHPDNLFTLLAPTHDLVVSESATSLCVLDVCEDPSPRPDDAGVAGVLGTAFDIWEERVALEPADRDPLAEFAEEPAVASAGSAEDEVTLGDIIDGAHARGTPVRLRSFLDSFDEDRPPTLYYLHAMLPHQPWITWPDGTGYRDPDVLGMSLPAEDRQVRYTWSDAEATVSEQRHLLQAQNTDRLMGEMLDALRDEGLYDDALIVLLGDHGVSFESRTSARIATEETLDSIAYAPLFVKPPGQTDGRVDDSNVMAVDVLPTVAQAVGVDVPWRVDGHPAGAPEIAARGTTKDFYLFAGLFAATLERVVQFDDATTFPSIEDRWIGSLAAAGDPASSLWEAWGVADLIGTTVHSHDPTDGGSAVVSDLPALVDPGVDEPPIGIVRGAVEEGPRQGTAMLAVGGRVVSAAPLAVDLGGVPRFSLLVRPGTIEPGDDVQLLVRDGGVTARLTLEG